MSYFLVVYDRSTGAVKVKEFADEQRDLALQLRFACERQQRGNPEIEVVVLGAKSREALEQTHARYFKTVQELARAGQ